MGGAGLGWMLEIIGDGDGAAVLPLIGVGGIGAIGLGEFIYALNICEGSK